MASSKTKWIAEESLRTFFSKNPVVYYWTFTMRDLCTKEEAEKRFKPFEDLMRRRGHEFLEFWELQKRGAWHVHLVTTGYLDVIWLREFMVKRGWGQQMKVKRVEAHRVNVPGKGWVLDDRTEFGLLRYLVKYLTKSFSEAKGKPGEPNPIWGKKKVFGGTGASKVGTTMFRWNPWSDDRAGSYLYHYGRQMWVEVFGSDPRWSDMARVLIMGAEATDFYSFNPWWEPSEDRRKGLEGVP